MAETMDLPRLGEFHECLSRASDAVARGTERGTVPVSAELRHNLGESSGVLQRKLTCDLVFVVVVGVAAHLGGGTGAHLRNAHFQQFFPERARLPSGEDHPRVGNGASDNGDEFLEIVVGDGSRWIDGVGRLCCRLEARHRYCMRPCAEATVEMSCVLHHRQHLETIIVETEESADTHVTETSDLCSVHRLQSVCKVGLGSCGVYSMKGGLMICLLKESVGSHTIQFVESFEIGDRQRRYFHVDSSNGTGRFCHRGFDSLYRLQELLKGELWMFACKEKQAAVTLPLKGFDLSNDLGCGEGGTRSCLVAAAVATVGAGVDAVARKIQRRKEHDAVAVDPLFDVKSCLVQLMDEVVFFRVNIDQHASLFQTEART
mmetsp:Transcript_15675/g.34058  ORF Transcript_15675/g.34058 Transcript_15675/m.34058 type:complete len:374 (-) Transcript_15675:244-1365(-)